MAQPGADLKIGPVVDLNDPAVAGTGNWLTQRKSVQLAEPVVDRAAVRAELVRHRIALAKLGIPSTEDLETEVDEHIAMAKKG